MSEAPLDLADGLRLSGLTYDELWFRYLELGGSRTIEQLRAHIDSEQCPDDHEHNVIAQALNDAYIEQDRDHPVAYRHLHELPDMRE